MLRFLIRRVLGASVILLLISFVTFFLFFAAPGDPALLACGKNCTPDALVIIRENLGLDKSIMHQFWLFLSGVFTGRDFAIGHCDAPCLGVSFNDNTMVWDTIIDRLPVTVSLTLGGLVLFLSLGIGAGLLAAAKKGTMVDKAASSTSLVLSSLQIYFIGPVILGAVVFSTGWLDAPVYNPFFEGPLAWATGLMIPWFVMSLIFTAQYTRMSRAMMIEQLQEDHVRTAKAKGMSNNYVFFRYAWRGAMVPIVTILGMDLGSMLGGAVVTEMTFGLAGIGRLAVQSVENIDLPLTMGVMLVGATFILIFNILVDAAYAFIDPRVRLS